MIVSNCTDGQSKFQLGQPNPKPYCDHHPPHLSLPTMGDSPMMTEARALFTCWLASLTSCWMQGMIWVRMESMRYSSPSRSQKSAGGRERRKNLSVGTPVQVGVCPASSPSPSPSHLNFTVYVHCTHAVISV